MLLFIPVATIAGDPAPMHPGSYVKGKLAAAKIKINFVAAKMEVSLSQFTDILNTKRRMTPRIALLLEKEFGFEAIELVRMQAEYDLYTEKTTQHNNNRKLD